MRRLPRQGFKVPGDGYAIGVDLGRTVKRALEAKVRSVDRLNFPSCVDTHPADLQNSCEGRDEHVVESLHAEQLQTTDAALF